nr:MAG TPA: hypothetical protein [Caudoviricetes sp.]
MVFQFEGRNRMIEFVKEAGMVFVWLFLGYLLGERQSKK